MVLCERLWSLQEVELDGENRREDLGSLNQRGSNHAEPLGSAHRQAPPEMPRTTLNCCAFPQLTKALTMNTEVNSSSTKWFLTDTLSHQTKVTNPEMHRDGVSMGRERRSCLGSQNFTQTLETIKFRGQGMNLLNGKAGGGAGFELYLIAQVKG